MDEKYTQWRGEPATDKQIKYAQLVARRCEPILLSRAELEEQGWTGDDPAVNDDWGVLRCPMCNSDEVHPFPTEAKYQDKADPDGRDPMLYFLCSDHVFALCFGSFKGVTVGYWDHMANIKLCQPCQAKLGKPPVEFCADCRDFIEMQILGGVYLEAR